MQRLFKGKVWKFGDDLDTDIIIPTQYVTIETMEEMKWHAFEPLRPELSRLITPGDIIVAGKNFGCGSSREQAPEVICALGIKCVIAKSFARIFFRNAINNGLLLIESPDLPDHCEEGDEVTVEINNKLVCNGREFAIPSMPDNLFTIIEDGGLVKSMKKHNNIAD
ncbi:MAG: 3-isopropylmalate dehydratase [Anaerosporomusa subterranea]|jgi:3-isopropylmalate/(R)-2-methylmalate dehydratase small subunit|nr:3-isopropylmalate dehydratase [Anaerosporomusa subterranea]